MSKKLKKRKLEGSEIAGSEKHMVELTTIELTTIELMREMEKKRRLECSIWNVFEHVDINMTQEEFDNFDPKNATRDVLINYSRQSNKLIDAMKSIIAKIIIVCEMDESEAELLASKLEENPNMTEEEIILERQKLQKK